MILTTDELKRVVNRLEDGKFVMIGTDDPYQNDHLIKKVIKKSSHKDDPYIWHYVICMEDTDG